jgi:hypothetical protein
MKQTRSPLSCDLPQQICLHTPTVICPPPGQQSATICQILRDAVHTHALGAPERFDTAGQQSILAYLDDSIAQGQAQCHVQRDAFIAHNDGIATLRSKLKDALIDFAENPPR